MPDGSHALVPIDNDIDPQLLRAMAESRLGQEMLQEAAQIAVRWRREERLQAALGRLPGDD